MKVLVSGGTGFVGNHLVRALAARGDDVHLVVRGERNQPDGSSAKRHISFHRHDGTTEGLAAILQNVRPDLVIHLASFFVPEHRAEDVAPLIASNLLFTAQLADAMVGAGVTRFLNTGTSWQHYQDRSYSPVSLYAATKQAAEALLQFYVEARGLRVLTLKLFNTYGSGDRRQKLFVLLKQAAETGVPLAMSPGEQRLDLVHIDDVVTAFLIASERLMRADAPAMESFAVCSRAALSLREVVANFERATGKHPPIRWGDRAYRSREVMSPWAGGEQLPGWSAKVSLFEGIRKMVESGDV
jgi:nucleoside-diphosphate-sugar epimerase